MTIYRKIITSDVTCESIEISDTDEEKYQNEELDLEEIWDKYEIEKKIHPEFCYGREFSQDIEFDESEH